MMVQDDPKNAHRMDVFSLRDQCEPGHGCQRTPPVPRLRLDNLQQRIRECDKTRKECIPTVTAAYEKPKEAVRGFGLNCWETFCHAFTPICCEGSLSAPVGNCYRTRLSVGEVVVASNVAVASWDGDDTSEESSLPDSLETSSMVEPVTGLLHTPGRLSPVCWTRADSHRCVMRTPDTRDVGLDFSATRSPSLRRVQSLQKQQHMSRDMPLSMDVSRTFFSRWSGWRDEQDVNAGLVPERLEWDGIVESAVPPCWAEADELFNSRYAQQESELLNSDDHFEWSNVPSCIEGLGLEAEGRKHLDQSFLERRSVFFPGPESSWRPSKAPSVGGA